MAEARSTGGPAELGSARTGESLETPLRLPSSHEPRIAAFAGGSIYEFLPSKTGRVMDLNLHQKMGIHHLNRVLDYSQFVAEGGRATVHLTHEDWQVVADVLFRMQTSREILPPEIEDYQLADNGRIIQIVTSDCVIDIDTM